MWFGLSTVVSNFAILNHEPRTKNRRKGDWGTLRPAEMAIERMGSSEVEKFGRREVRIANVACPTTCPPQQSTVGSPPSTDAVGNAGNHENTGRSSEDEKLGSRRSRKAGMGSLNSEVRTMNHEQRTLNPEP